LGSSAGTPVEALREGARAAVTAGRMLFGARRVMAGRRRGAPVLGERQRLRWCAGDQLIGLELGNGTRQLTDGASCQAGGHCAMRGDAV